MMKKWVMMAVLLLLAAPGPAPGASQADAPGVTPGAAAPADPVANGRIDYRAKCANCHGANALLTVRTARKLGVDPRKLSLMATEMSREEMITITEKGKGKMPGFEKELTKERIAGVVDYVLDYRAKRIKQESLIRKKEPISPQPAPEKAAEAGKEKAP